MKVLYYDCFCGISGDMNLGALVDLGVDAEYLTQELLKLQLEDEYQLQIAKGSKNGISGTRVDVMLHEHHHHEHAPHQHRNLQDIKTIIGDSSLAEKVKELSIDMFMKVAEAEAKVHGKTVEEVHFHEVGATDSIIDFVGAAVALDYLAVDQILASSVEVGGGFVKCAHGVIPVPAPAIAEILKGVPIKFGLVPFETTTPTGAAILKTNVKAFTDSINFSIEKIGYGIGQRDLSVPNVLRVYLGNMAEARGHKHD
ncbi:nickel pincer cofactor biosynthesis protein LarC [Pelosinus propionicus]|uniref:TIGR00299 family protein n=1 Tax=Pelosinus propionicus DSM 13327 TaxID=1123291 RepID=A0A1I4M3U5_9FIRM|nr:nickel pincer cofactor biosynthesis protein LarC [Pelosinus propionicus]SFL97912.1 hypothetical protein SAMN04490355_102952 [Pelosinus propionicus DSM 13327]